MRPNGLGVVEGRSAVRQPIPSRTGFPRERAQRSAGRLHSGQAVRGDAQGTVLTHTTVVVDGTGTIERVGPASEVNAPPGYRRIDATGRYVVPGLINAHAHLFADGKPLPKVLSEERFLQHTAPGPWWVPHAAPKRTVPEHS